MKKDLKVKDSDFARMEKVESKHNKYVAKGFHLYFSYSIRIFFMFLAIFVIGMISYANYLNSFSKSNDVEMSYEQKASIDYKVTLLPGNPFETGNLSAVNSYIADYIDDISTDFIYDYKVGKDSDIEYSYYVNAIMELKSDKDGQVHSRRVDTLIPEITDTLENTKELNFKQNVNLDYNYFNNLAKNFSTSVNNEHGIEITGYLYLEMHLNVITNNKEFSAPLVRDEVIKVEIPLLSTQVKAAMVNSINKKDSYKEHEAATLISKSSLFVAISLWIVDIIFLLLVCSFIMKSTPKKSNYMRVRNNLLKEYDNVIVNSKNDPNFKGYNVINCASFQELLDAQKVLNKPIIYNEYIKNQKSMFIIINDKDVYRYILKEADLDYYNND